MSLSPSEVWNRLLDRARQELPQQTFQAWLEPTEALSIEGSTLIVGAPDQFTADWNESKHAAMFASFAPIALGHPLNVVFRVHEERKKRPQMDFFVAPPAASVLKPGSTQNGVTSTPLSERYTFDLFVIGKSNEMAAATAHAVSQAPGKVYNPLFIYGATGLGKTHLMQAVAHETRQRNSSARITYVGAEQFMNEFIRSIGERKTPDFRKRYRETDLLLVDDVHFLKGKESTQEEFFHTFNALYEGGRQIVLTSDRAPSDIAGLEARLVSRFEWGMVTDIDAPDFEHRVAILQQKAQLDHLELTIPDEVIHFIAENVRSSVRELEGSIIKLLAYASLKHKDITVEVAREALRDKLRGTDQTAQAESASLTISAIQQTVAREWGVTAEGLRSKTRTKNLTVPRQIAIYLTREMLGTALVEIGNAFGKRDHSTVIHSLDKVENDMGSSDELRTRVGKVRAILETLGNPHQGTVDKRRLRSNDVDTRRQPEL